MLTILTAAVLASLAPLQGVTDTTFAVPAGASLSVNNFGGSIIVHGWTQNRVKVHAEHGSRDGAPSVVDFEVTVPQDMALTLSGTYTEITVDGVRGAISAETVDGSVD